MLSCIDLPGRGPLARSCKPSQTSSTVRTEARVASNWSLGSQPVGPESRCSGCTGSREEKTKGLVICERHSSRVRTQMRKSVKHCGRQPLQWTEINRWRSGMFRTLKSFVMHKSSLPFLKRRHAHEKQFVGGTSVVKNVSPLTEVVSHLITAATALHVLTYPQIALRQLKSLSAVKFGTVLKTL